MSPRKVVLHSLIFVLHGNDPRNRRDDRMGWSFAEVGKGGDFFKPKRWGEESSRRTATGDGRMRKRGTALEPGFKISK